MPNVLYVGDKDSDNATRSAYRFFNHRTNSEQPWEVHEAPWQVPLAREGVLEHWLKGEIQDFPPPQYEGIVIDWEWRDSLPAIREINPNTPIIMLLAPVQKFEGADYCLPFFDINKLPERMNELIDSKKA